MPWFAVDDGFPEHEKLEELEPDYVLHSLCVACWTLLGADCARRRTGGFVSKARLAKVLAFWPAKARERAAGALVEPLRLWEVSSDGWQFHDWDDYQPSFNELQEERNLKTERQRKWRANKRAERLQRLRVDVYGPSTPASTPVDETAASTPSTKPSTLKPQARARINPIPSPHPLSPSPAQQKTQESLRGTPAAPGEPAPAGLAQREPDAATLDVAQPPRTTHLWLAYAAAYVQRYKTEPVRNAKVNGQLKQFLSRVPADEAPHIAQHYVRSQNARYVASGHSIGCLLQDAEKLRTEWATGRQGTASAAREADRTASRRDGYEEMFARLAAEDAADARKRGEDVE